MSDLQTPEGKDTEETSVQTPKGSNESEEELILPPTEPKAVPDGELEPVDTIVIKDGESYRQMKVFSVKKANELSFFKPANWWDHLSITERTEIADRYQIFTNIDLHGIADKSFDSLDNVDKSQIAFLYMRLQAEENLKLKESKATEDSLLKVEENPEGVNVEILDQWDNKKKKEGTESVDCEFCEGKGKVIVEKKGVKECPRCEGEGTVETNEPNQEQVSQDVEVPQQEEVPQEVPVEEEVPLDESEESIAVEEFKEEDHPRASDGKFGSGGGSSDKPKEDKPSWMPSEEELHKQAETNAKMEYMKEYGSSEWEESTEEEKEEAIAEHKEKLIKNAEYKHKQDNIDKSTDKFSQKKHDEFIEISWRMLSKDEKDNAIDHIGQQGDKWKEKYSFGSHGLSFKEAYDRLHRDGYDSMNFSLYDALAYTGNYKDEEDNAFLVGMSPQYDLDRFENINNKIIQGHNNAKNNFSDSKKKMKSVQKVFNSLQKKGDVYSEAGKDLYYKTKRNMDNAKYELEEYDERLKATKEMAKKMKSLAEESKSTESCGCKAKSMEAYQSFVSNKLEELQSKAKSGESVGLLYGQEVEVDGRKIKGTLAYAGVSLNDRIYLPEELAKGDGKTLPLLLNHSSISGAEMELDRLDDTMKQHLENGRDFKVGEVTLEWMPEQLTLYYEGEVTDNFFKKEIDEMNMSVSLGIYYDSDSPSVCNDKCYTVITGAEFREVSLVYHAGFPIATIEEVESGLKSLGESVSKVKSYECKTCNEGGMFEATEKDTQTTPCMSCGKIDWTIMDKSMEAQLLPQLYLPESTMEEIKIPTVIIGKSEDTSV